MAYSPSCNWTHQGGLESSHCGSIGVSSVLSLVLLALVTTMAVAVSSFIMFTIFKGFFKKQDISTRNKILCALSFSNMSFSIWMSLRILTRIVFLRLDIFLDVIVSSLMIYSAVSSVWLTFCLCLFYLIKIIPFQSRCLSLMKLKIDVIIPWSIVVVEVACLCSSILQTILIVFPLKSLVSTTVMERNLLANRVLLVTYLNNVTSVLVVVVFTSFTFISLKLHVHKMSRTLGPPGSAQLDSYRGALRTLKHFLGIYVFFMLDMAVANLLDFPKFPFLSNLILISFLLFGPLQSFIIIRGDPKLREEWRKLWDMCHEGPGQRRSV